MAPPRQIKEASPPQTVTLVPLAPAPEPLGIAAIDFIENYPTLNTNDVGWQLLNGPGWRRTPPNPPDWVETDTGAGSGPPAKIEDYPPISTMGVGWQISNERSPSNGPLWRFQPTDPSGWNPVGNIFPAFISAPIAENAIIVDQPGMPPGGVFLLQENATLNVHDFYDLVQNFGLLRTTMSVYAKAGPGAVRYLVLNLQCTPYTDFATAVFDLAAGTVTQTMATGSATILSVSCIPATDGFFQCSLSAIGQALYPVWALSDQPVIPADNLTAHYGEPAYQGDGTSGLYMHGVSFVAPPPPLTGSESDGTNLYPINPLIFGGTLVAAPSVVAPDGTTGSVQSFQEDGTFTSRAFGDTNFSSAGLTSMTVSTYVKAGARQVLAILIGLTTSWDTIFLVLDCHNGVILSQTIANGSTFGGPLDGVMVLKSATVQAAANGFWKLTVSATCSNDTFFSWLQYPLANALVVQNPMPVGWVNTLQYQGTAGLDAVYVWRIKATSP